MELLLKEDVTNLGKSGEIITVKRGYGRNYLLPKGIGLPITKANIDAVNKANERRRIKFEAEMADRKKFAESLSEMSITIAAKVSDEDTLYGSVGEEDIVEALKEEGFEVDRKVFKMGEPIKKTGLYEIQVRLAPEIVTTIKVWVVAEEEEEA